MVLNIFLVIGCTSNVPVQQATATNNLVQELIPVKIAIGPFTSFAPLFIAQEEGYFAEEGLAVEFVNLPRTGDMLPALVQSEVDIGGVILTSSILNLIAEGVNIRFVADRGFADPQGCTYSAVMARPELVDASLESIVGSRVATDEATYHEFFLEQAFNNRGLNHDRVTVESVIISSLPDLMSSNQIDYATAVEPWITIMENANQSQTWARAEEIIPDYQLLFYIFGPSILDGNRDIGTRFMRAYLLAKAQYNEGKTDRNVEIIAQYTDLDPNVVRTSCWVPLRDDLRINVESVLMYQNWSMERGYSESEVEVADFWDPSFIDEALAGQ